MNSLDTLTHTLPAAYDNTSIACRLLDLLPLCLEADECFELMLLSKLFFTRTGVTREQFMQATEQRQRTGLSIEHLLVRNGHCEMKDALAVVAERRRILRLIQQEAAPWDFAPQP